jgi:hypothetical protein
MFCGQLAVNCFGIKKLFGLKQNLFRSCFLTLAPGNRHTLAWRGVSYRLRIRQGTKVNMCFQAVTHAAFAIYVCANCRLFYLYHFSVWFWHISRIRMNFFSVKIVRRHTVVKSADHTCPYCLLLTTEDTFQHAFSQHLPLLVRRASILARSSASSGRHTRRSNVPVPMTATAVVVHW